MRDYARDSFVGIFVIIGLVCVAYLTIKLGKMEISSSDTYSIHAKFNSIAGLRVGANIEIAGVNVGRVSDIKLEQNDEGSLAVVTLKIKNGVELSDTAIASVKTSGLIGDKYISISPGGSPDMLKNGQEITDTESALDIESMISKYIFGKV